MTNMSELKSVLPFSELPDRSNYQHLSEVDRMLKGFPHRSGHPDIIRFKLPAKPLIEEFNKTSYDDKDSRSNILQKLLHPLTKGSKNVDILPTFRASCGVNIILGNNFFADHDCCFLDGAYITFGDNCKVGPNVDIYTTTHPINGAFRRPDDEENYFDLASPVTIGNFVWIGGNSIICPGVTLGNNVIVKEASVVTKSFPDNTTIGGNPAIIIEE